MLAFRQILTRQLSTRHLLIRSITNLKDDGNGIDNTSTPTISNDNWSWVSPTEKILDENPLFLAKRGYT
jgi:hypothetical protein